MDTLVVQAGIRHGRAADLARSHDGKLSIGRGYGNDLVLTDLHVAPQQLAFYRDGLQWQWDLQPFWRHLPGSRQLAEIYRDRDRFFSGNREIDSPPIIQAE